MARPDSLVEEVRSLERRLAELQKLLADGPPPENADEMKREEHRLESRLQEISDETAEEGEGLAETLVKGEGANADEFPELPSSGEDHPNSKEGPG